MEPISAGIGIIGLGRGAGSVASSGGADAGVYEDAGEYKDAAGALTRGSSRTWSANAALIGHTQMLAARIAASARVNLRERLPGRFSSARCRKESVDVTITGNSP